MAFDSIFGSGYIIIVYHLLQVIIVVNAIIMLVNYMFNIAVLGDFIKTRKKHSGHSIINKQET